jgi:hypothetical protein
MMRPYILRYLDKDDECCPVMTVRYRGHSGEHAIERFYESEDSDGWIVLSFERAAENAASQYRQTRHNVASVRGLS